MIDNFELIKPLLKFDDEDDFYFLQIIQRKKDHPKGHVHGTGNNHRMIKAYYIKSTQHLDEVKDEIIAISNLFGARAGISLNRRNRKEIALEMLSHLALNIKNKQYAGLSGIYNTICGQHHSAKDKTWIVDIDNMEGVNMSNFTEFVKRTIVEECEPFNKEKILAEIPTKNGLHLITTPFNSKTFMDILGENKYPNMIHKNNPTILYIPDIQ
jgi:hypothetical protein